MHAGRRGPAAISSKILSGSPASTILHIDIIHSTVTIWVQALCSSGSESVDSVESTELKHNVDSCAHIQSCFFPRVIGCVCVCSLLLRAALVVRRLLKHSHSILCHMSALTCSKFSKIPPASMLTSRASRSSRFGEEAIILDSRRSTASSGKCACDRTGIQLHLLLFATQSSSTRLRIKTATVSS